jgi:hypothetical protein
MRLRREHFVGALDVVDAILPLPSASTTMVSPSWNSRRGMPELIGFSSRRWMVRHSGRAPTATVQ